MRVMSDRPMGTRLAPLPPACGPAPVVAVPAATATISRTRYTRVRRRTRRVTAGVPRPGPWVDRRQSSTDTASRAMPTMKWVMTT